MMHLKDSPAARLAATSRTVESLCAKIHMKLDSFEETYDELSPRELSRTLQTCMIALLPAAILYV